MRGWFSERVDPNRPDPIIDTTPIQIHPEGSVAYGVESFATNQPESSTMSLPTDVAPNEKIPPVPPMPERRTPILDIGPAELQTMRAEDLRILRRQVEEECDRRLQVDLDAVREEWGVL